MIWDCVLLDNELDMLEFRLRTLDGMVDRWVIVEAGQCHRGDRKPFYYMTNQQRFAAWDDRITYIQHEFPWGSSPWQKDHMQRDACYGGLGGAEAGDLVLLGDLDEIPRLESLPDLAAGPVVFEQRCHVFAVDWQDPEPWPGTIAIQRAHLTGPAMISSLRLRRTGLPRIPDGGWHFTWLGGPDAISFKARGNAHLEQTARILAANAAGRCYEHGWIPWHDRQQTAAEVDGSWPELIQARKVPPSWFRPR